MQISALQLSQLLNGEVEGNPDAVISNFGKIEEAEPGMLCFLGNPKYETYAYSTRATILIVGKDFKPRQPIRSTLIKVDNVYASVAALMEKFSAQEELPQGISKKASIHPDAKIGNGVYIGDFAVVDKNTVIADGAALYPHTHIAANCSIGAHTKIYSGVKIYKNVRIGDHCIVQANAVIGGDGFGFAPQSDGTYKKIQHLGNVILEKNVEVGANTTIDRASMGSTIIRQGVKLDNLIQIAHNVEIGENTVIAAGTAIAGSTKIGKNCRIGGQVGISGHLVIADGTQIQAQSGLNYNTKVNDKLFGSPALPYMNYLRSYGVFKTLPELAKRIEKLEKWIVNGKW